MKYFAASVFSDDSEGVAAIVLVKFTAEKLMWLSKLKETALLLDQQLEGNFANLALLDSTAHWLIVFGEVMQEDEVTSKIYEKLCGSEDGFLELPEEVYENRIASHSKLYDSSEGGGMLRTEIDLLHVTKTGVYFSCEEKHCFAAHESSVIAWTSLFS